MAVNYTIIIILQLVYFRIYAVSILISLVAMIHLA